MCNEQGGLGKHIPGSETSKESNTEPLQWSPGSALLCAALHGFLRLAVVQEQQVYRMASWTRQLLLFTLLASSCSVGKGVHILNEDLYKASHADAVPRDDFADAANLSWPDQPEGQVPHCSKYLQGGHQASFGVSNVLRCLTKLSGLEPYLQHSLLFSVTQ